MRALAKSLLTTRLSIMAAAVYYAVVTFMELGHELEGAEFSVTTILEQLGSMALQACKLLLSISVFWYLLAKRGPLSCIFDPIAEKMRQVFMGETSSYNSNSDELLLLIAYIREVKDEEQIPRLDALCENNAQRVIGWQEYAKLQAEVLNNPSAALAIYERAAQKIRNKQDKALMLYRAANLAQNKLQDTAKAQELYRQAAEKFPHTTYGALAEEKLID